MKRLLFTIAALFPFGTVFAQDIIIWRNGDEQQAKVLEISDSHIKFRRWSSLQDGPVYTKSLSEIFMIKYEDGTKESFADKHQPVAGGESLSLRNPDAVQYTGGAEKLREKRLFVGAKTVLPQINFLFVASNTYDNVNYTGCSGIRVFGSFGATCDWYVSAIESNRWFAHGGLEYHCAGGNLSGSGNDIFRTDYLNLDLGFGIRGGLAYFIPGIRLGILANAKCADPVSRETVPAYNYCNPLTFAVTAEGGFCIGKNIDLGIQWGIGATNVTKPILWNGRNPSSSMSLGIAFTYRFGIL